MNLLGHCYHCLLLGFFFSESIWSLVYGFTEYSPVINFGAPYGFLCWHWASQYIPILWYIISQGLLYLSPDVLPEFIQLISIPGILFWNYLLWAAWLKESFMALLPLSPGLPYLQIWNILKYLISKRTKLNLQFGITILDTIKSTWLSG